MLAAAAVTVIDVRVFTGAVTVSVADPVTLFRLAVTVVEPAATPVAMPDAFTVAIDELATVQLATEDTSLVVPSM
jgi:hypothetical protein